VIFVFLSLAYFALHDDFSIAIYFSANNISFFIFLYDSIMVHCVCVFVCVCIILSLPIHLLLEHISLILSLVPYTLFSSWSSLLIIVPFMIFIWFIVSSFPIFLGFCFSKSQYPCSLSHSNLTWTSLLHLAAFLILFEVTDHFYKKTFELFGTSVSLDLISEEF
jgi:hypothetical protein